MRYEKFNWGPGIFIITYHLALFVLLPYYLIVNGLNLTAVWVTLIFLFMSGISVSAGYHRYYAHKAYNANKLVESVLLFFSTMALQGSALYWSYEHRLHHRFTDKEEDPHSIKKGFLYAHMLWIFRKPKPIDMNLVQDLAKSSLLRFQHRFYVPLTITLNAAALLLIYFVTKDAMGTFVIGFLARVFLLHHFTWFINSLAHTAGDRTYSGEQTAVDNYLMALVTWGEGYHNYHHVFASDYRNGIKWYHFDPSKWLLWTLSKFGMVRDLKKVSQATIQRTIINEDKKIMLESLKNNKSEMRIKFEEKINELAEYLNQKIAEIGKLASEYSSIDKKQKRSLKLQLKDANRAFRQKWKEWVRISKEITILDKKSDFKYNVNAV